MTQVNPNTPTAEKRGNGAKNTIIVILALAVILAFWRPWEESGEQTANNTDKKAEINTPGTSDVNVQEEKQQDPTTTQNLPSGAGQNQVNSSSEITFENSDQLFFNNGLGGYNAVVFRTGLVSEPVGIMGATIDGRYFVREAEVNLVRPIAGAKLKFKGNASIVDNEWVLKETELINGYYIYQTPEKSPLWISDRGISVFCFQFTTERDKPLPAGHIPHLFKYAGAKMNADVM